MRIYQRWLIIILTSFVSLSIFANAINTVTISVPDRSQAALQAGLRTALSDVMVRMSGNPQIMTLPDIRAAVSDANNWVQNYSYVTSSTADSGLGLQVTFDHAGLSKILHKTGQIVWREDRPLTLVYLDAGNEALQNTFQQTAKADGISVIFPVMDLADENIVQGAATVLSPTQLKQLGERYGVSSILAAHFISTDHQVTQMNWLYSLNGNTFQWTTTGDASEVMVGSAVYHLLRVMQNQFAMNVEQGARSTLTIKISGIEDMTDYAEMIRDLKKQTVIRSVAADAISANHVTLTLDIVGSKIQLEKSLSLDPKFSPVIVAGENMDQTVLQYFW